MSNIFDSGKYFNIISFNMSNIFDSAKYSHLKWAIYLILTNILIWYEQYFQHARHLAAGLSYWWRQVVFLVCSWQHVCYIRGYRAFSSIGRAKSQVAYIVREWKSFRVARFRLLGWLNPESRTVHSWVANSPGVKVFKSYFKKTYR